MTQKAKRHSLFISPLTTCMPAISRFVVADVIRVDHQIGGITIVWIGPNFQRHFLEVIEENVPTRTLPSHQLSRYAREKSIITALGGTMKNLGPATTALAHLFGVISLGSNGPGLFNGDANIGHAVSLVNKKPWAVRWQVSGGKLSIGAIDPALLNPGWGKGHRVYGG